jgi:hypothetical protein
VVIVLGCPSLRAQPTLVGARAGGLAVAVARAAVAAGARVELVGKIGDDAAGDAIAVDLERAGIGHAALLRDPAAVTPTAERALCPALTAADVELALRYLVDFRVVVVADVPARDVADVVAELAGFAGAHRVLVGGSVAEGPDITQLRPGAGDHAAFAALVGAYAAMIDAGGPPADAFARASADVGWQSTGDG